MDSAASGTHVPKFPDIHVRGPRSWRSVAYDDHRMRLLWIVLLAVLPMTGAAQPLIKKPKVVVLLVVDQLAAGAFQRAKSALPGLARLEKQSVVFADARYSSAPSVTACGHATLATGVNPSVHGIISVHWYDRQLKKRLYCVEDDRYPMLEGEPGSGRGRSPAALRVPTLGDAFRWRFPGSKVIAIAGKDRSAILLGGHKADFALWLDGHSGGFNSSRYYGTALPAWVQRTNESLRARRAAQKTSPEAFVSELLHTPEADQLVLKLALEAAKAERLNELSGPHLLAVSLSGHDGVLHHFGAEDPQARAALQTLDRAIPEFVQGLEKLFGKDQVLFALTADHGGHSHPSAAGPATGVVDYDAMEKALRKELNRVHGAGEWISSNSEAGYYFAEDAPGRPRPVDTAYRFLRGRPEFAAVLRRDDLPAWAGSPFGRILAAGYDDVRGADLVLAVLPYQLEDAEERGAHGSTFGYDLSVPLWIRGTGLKPRTLYRRADMTSLAPTLAILAGATPPDAWEGELLNELLEGR
jgi:hypothetical protein